MITEIFDFEDENTPSTYKSKISINTHIGDEVDELCDTLAELNPSSSPVATRPISIQANGHRRNSSSGFLPGSADGRAGRSLEIGIRSPFVSSFAENYVPSSPVDTISPVAFNEPQKKLQPSDFKPLKVLGQGTYGKVLLVRETRTNRLFAQKQLKKASMIVEEKHVVQTRTEREILESVRHPYIVKLFYAMQDKEKLYLILEYAQGGELFNYLADQSMLSEDAVQFYCAEMILALYHLHVNVGVVYRDLKPENCLLDSEGHLVLTDFGLSKVATDSDASCRTFLGTPEYMAPEILEGLEYDYAVDWWSLGAVCYDLLTGNPPYPGDDHKTILGKIWKSKKVDFPFYLTRDAQNFMSRLLVRNPKSRWGYKDIEKIKNHSFFDGIEWDLLERRDPNIVPPIVPIITDPEKAENFSKEFTDMPLSPPVHNSHMDIPNRNSGKGFGFDEDSHPFRGFSFTASKSFIDSEY